MAERPPPMSLALGVDMGGTATRWVLAGRDDAVLARGTAPGATGHLFNPAARAAFTAVMTEIAGVVGEGHGISAAFVGITGLGPTAQAEAQAIIGAAMGIEPARVRTSDDMELAFRAAFAPGAGHLVSAGTGSNGLHIAADGASIRVGGRGILIDDGGSGAWIALNALDRLYRAIDATGGPGDASRLAQHLFDAMGGDDWEATRAYVYGADRGRIGALARCVADAAEAGDLLARDIMDGAIAELARLARALVGRAGDLPIGYVGGVLDLSPAVKPGLVAALAGHDVVFPAIDAARTAALMAAR